jgi:catechol 2,3-dioxygenase
MIGIKRVGHIALTVADIDASLEFYRDALGLTVSDREVIKLADGSLMEGAWVRCGTDHHCLALFCRPSDEGVVSANGGLRPDATRTPGLNHFAFELGSFEELTRAHAALKNARVPVVAARQYGPGSQVRFYCLDPDGNRVEFYWNLDQVGWDGSTRVPRPIEDIDLEDYDLAEFLAYKDAHRSVRETS